MRFAGLNKRTCQATRGKAYSVILSGAGQQKRAATGDAGKVLEACYKVSLHNPWVNTASEWVLMYDLVQYPVSSGMFLQ